MIGPATENELKIASKFITGGASYAGLGHQLMLEGAKVQRKT